MSNLRGKFVVVDLATSAQQSVTQIDQMNGLQGDSGREINLLIQNGKTQQNYPQPYDLTGKTVALCVEDPQGKVQIGRMMERYNDTAGLCRLTIPAPFFRNYGVSEGFIAVYDDDKYQHIVGSMPICFEIRQNKLLVGMGDGIGDCFDSQYNELFSKVTNLSTAIAGMGKDIADAQGVNSQQLGMYKSLVADQQKAINDNQVATKTDLGSVENRVGNNETDIAQMQTSIKSNGETASNAQKSADDANSGVKDLNALVADINKKNTPWSAWQHEGTSMANGATIYSDSSTDVFYSTRFVNGQREVDLRFTCKGVWKAGMTCVTLPEFLQPRWPECVEQPCRDNAVASWFIKGGNVIMGTNTDNKYTNSDWYNFHHRYIAKETV